MAINRKLPGVEVVIVVNGQPTKEFVDETVLDGPDADETVLKYMESISDSRFTIKTTIHPTYAGVDDLSFTYVLDGNKTPRPHCYDHNAGGALP